MLAECISFGAAPNKAIVGANAFAHAAGIHQHGVMANPLTYEIMTPESVGVPHNSLVLGKHSGRRALEHRLVELGHNLPANPNSTPSTTASPNSPTAKKPSTTRTSSASCNPGDLPSPLKPSPHAIIPVSNPSHRSSTSGNIAASCSITLTPYN